MSPPRPLTINGTHPVTWLLTIWCGVHGELHGSCVFGLLNHYCTVFLGFDLSPSKPIIEPSYPAHEEHRVGNRGCCGHHWRAGPTWWSRGATHGGQIKLGERRLPRCCCKGHRPCQRITPSAPHWLWCVVLFCFLFFLCVAIACSRFGYVHTYSLFWVSIGHFPLRMPSLQDSVYQALG